MVLAYSETLSMRSQKRFSYKVNPMLDGDYLMKVPSNARVQ